ncbi:TadE/TadG family type IV pilus assembly protein [Desulfonatronum parangueonense]
MTSNQKLKPKSSKKNQIGATAVEFAIVILIFITIIFGIIEFGLLMYNQHIVTNAGREGARVGLVYRTTGNRISEIAIKNKIIHWNDHIITFGEKKWDVIVTPCVASASNISVEIKYNYDFLFLPFQREITSITKMRCE